MTNKSRVDTIASDVDGRPEHAGFAPAAILHNLKDRAQDLQEKAMHFRDDATSYVKENYVKAREKSLVMEDKVVTYVRENPIKAVGFSILAGVALAKLLRSRK